MLILNLGCGPKTSPNCVNIDWSFYLRIKRNPVLRLMALPLLSRERRKRLLQLDDTILVHNLKKGLPFESGSVDAVYHSHMLEHLDREDVPGFLSEVRRVLKEGGIHRICVPDLEHNVGRYLESLQQSERGEKPRSEHDRLVALLLEYSVRKASAAAQLQRPFVRFVENFVVGDARRRGETHQWMYDRINLPALLEGCGFTSVKLTHWNVSDISAWKETGLEDDEAGNEYKPDSLYVEARK